MKKLLPVFLSVILMFVLVTAVIAAVEVKSAGTVVDKTETIDFTGPTIVKSGTDVTIDVTQLTALTVDNDVYSTKGLMADGSLYLTGEDGMWRPLFLPQSDGGCSMCGVDSGGTSFACINVSCPNGMTR